MLLRVRVGNHLSIRDPQELSLIASTLRDEDTGLIDTPALRDNRVLPAALILGANASGKSNLLDAFRFLRTAVLYSHARSDPKDGTGRSAFALDPEFSKRPTHLDVDFIVDGVWYTYGFEASDDEFTEEWLYSFPKHRRQKLFQRKGRDFIFGRGLKGKLTSILEFTRGHKLFLSVASQSDHPPPLLSKIIAFFGGIWGTNAIEIDNVFLSALIAKRGLDERVFRFLDKAGVGIVAYRAVKVPFATEEIELQKAYLTYYAKKGRFGNGPLPEPQQDWAAIELEHEGPSGSPVYLGLECESAGTRRLLLLLGAIFQALDDGSPVFIDDLDSSLHSQACDALISLFASKETNPHGAQLVATTHDTNLLRSQYLRRDQIWFTEKDRNGATCVYPLTDIRTRKGDDVEKAYLQGRYGAVPFAGSLPPSYLIG